MGLEHSHGLQSKPLNTSVKQFIIKYTSNEKIGLEHSPFLLTKIEHDSTIFPPLLLAYTFDVLDHIRQHNQPNTIHYSLFTIHTYLYIFIRIYMYSYVFTISYVFIRIHYFTWKSNEIP